MANERSGLFGTYYGSYFDESEPLTEAEMQANVTYIYKYLAPHGWTKNAVAAMCGNMQAESTINPGRWQSDSVGNYSLGYGLVQWTPVTKYTDWCSEAGYSDPSEMNANLARIVFELQNNLQWYATDSYNISFAEFSTSSEDSGTLAKAFLLNYERPADQSSSVQEYRASLADNWYSYLSGVEPGTPTDPDTPGTSAKSRKKRYNFILFNQRRLQRGKARIY